jgi:hypothetical protein
MQIDFREVPNVNTATALMDSFEFFARDYLRELGYEILKEPSRGADGGMDLIVQNRRSLGKENEIIKTWLVSCKHFAQSGKSVGLDDEHDILDRVRAHHCQGFLGFYSTLPSSALRTRLDNLRTSIDTLTIDRESIEAVVIGNPRLVSLFQRYFPSSYHRWRTEVDKYEPVRLMDLVIDKYYYSFKHDLALMFTDSVVMIKLLRRFKTFEDVAKALNMRIHFEPVLRNYAEWIPEHSGYWKSEGVDWGKATFKDLLMATFFEFRGASFDSIKNVFRGGNQIFLPPVDHKGNPMYSDETQWAFYYFFPGKIFMNDQGLEVLNNLCRAISDLID